MSKSKINPLIPLILGRSQIVPPLLLSPSTPNLLPPPIFPNIIRLSQSIQNQIHARNPNQNFIPTVIIRRIVRAINIRWNDIPQLYRHIVEGGSDGTCPNRVCVPRLKSDLDGVDIWISDEKCEDGETDPWRGAWGYNYECNQEWKTPDLSDCRNVQSRIEFLTQPCPKQNLGPVNAKSQRSVPE